ncbi:MAG TPA: quinone-dependent dihydroorotate dehydrogenase [Saprospiraceae bacterium]|nr:quinone-dependent dihydroorotate dehydrogenase [Saprospiraceae bacterium]HMQ83497.1 quinone-dependent dihydroorotate dehydrogenase [Saprospiraceae bacterium]
MPQKVYSYLLKPMLFLLSPEQAHHLTLFLLKLMLRLPLVGRAFRSTYEFKHPSLERALFGLRFPNPVGLAAGFDKDGQHFEAMSSLGFGFIEVGTITPMPQAGNPRPRLFRLPQDRALINRMGFNNEGVDALVTRLKKARQNKLIIGGNIGKNKLTPNEEAAKDYLLCFKALFPYVDYFVVNVSSPNTPDLRALQEKEPLSALLQTLQSANLQQPKPKPILLKIAPDLNEHQLDDIIEIVQETNLAGIIATNTTIARDGLKTKTKELEKIGAGGLSGLPLRQRSTEVIRYLHKRTQGKIPIIGVGGINSPEDAMEKLKAGASLIQIYTGLIYEGPDLIKRINQSLIQS